MKKIILFFILFSYFYIYSFSVLEIKNEIYLLQKNTNSKIVLNDKSWGIKLYPNDIIQTPQNSSCKIGNEDGFIELRENSKITIEKTLYQLNMGNYFIENFPIPLKFSNAIIKSQNGIGKLYNSQLKVLSGKIIVNKVVLHPGDIYDFKNQQIIQAKPNSLPIKKTILKKKLVKLSKDQIKNINQKSMALAKKGAIEKAIEILEKAIKNAPNETSFLNNLGVLYQQLGNYSKAMNYYKKVLILKPNDKTVYYNIVCLYSRQKDQLNVLLWYNRERKIFTKFYNKEALQDPDLDFLRKLTNDFTQ